MLLEALYASERLLLVLVGPVQDDVRICLLFRYIYQPLEDQRSQQALMKCCTVAFESRLQDRQISSEAVP